MPQGAYSGQNGLRLLTKLLRAVIVQEVAGLRTQIAAGRTPGLSVEGRVEQRQPNQIRPIWTEHKELPAGEMGHEPGERLEPGLLEPWVLLGILLVGNRKSPMISIRDGMI